MRRGRAGVPRLMSRTHLKQLASESIVYGISGALSKFLYFFLVPVYTRIFMPEDYGVMSLVSNGMSLVAIIVTMGLDSAAARWFFDTEDTDERKKTFSSWAWCNLLLAFIFALVIGVMSEPLGSALAARGDAPLYLRLSSISLTLGVLGTVVNNWLRLQRRPWATMWFSLGTNLLTICATIVLVVVLRTGLKGVYLAQVITAAVSTLIAALLLRDWINPLRFSCARLREMAVFSVPLIPAGLSFWIVNLSGIYFIRGFASTADVGLFQVGTSFASAVALITAAFQQAWGPFALSIHRQEGAQKVYADVLIAYMLITCFACTLLSLFAPEILRLVTTKAYLGAGRVIGILSFNYLVIGLGYIAVIGATIARTSTPYGSAVVVASVITIGLNWGLVPLWGKEGAALSTLFAQSLVPLYVFYRSQKLYPIPYRFRAAGGTFVTAFAISMAGGGLLHGNIAIDILIKLLMLALFFGAVFALRMITLADIRTLLTEFGMLKRSPA
jgi:O-antigen/teichoic acid export membrane protein